MGDTKGTWYLSSDKIRIYNCLWISFKKWTKIIFSRKPGEYVPLLVDIDLKKEVNGYPQLWV